MALYVKRLTATAVLPTRSTPNAAGYDLFSTESYVIKPGDRAVVSTGIQIGLPDGVYGRVAPRSGHAVKNGLCVGAGVIDRDYQGEVKVILFNHDQRESFVIKPGYRIAQLILEKLDDQSPVVEVDSIQYPGSDRGTAGFGSTGQ